MEYTTLASKGEQDGQTTKHLDAGVQTPSGAVGEEQRESDEPGGPRARHQRQRAVSVVQTRDLARRAGVSWQWASKREGARKSVA